MKITLNDVSSEELQACVRLMDFGVQNPAVGLKALEGPHAANFVMKFNVAVQAALADEAKPKSKPRARKLKLVKSEAAANG